MLNALSVSLAADVAGRRRAMQSFARQGLKYAGALDWPGGVLDAWANPLQSSADRAWIHTSEGAACCVGPIWYRGRFGNEALQWLIDGADASANIDESALRGNFALFLRRGDRAWLLNDPLGLVQIHASDDGRFHSTSWLATRAYTGRNEIDEAAAIEYVLLGASHSGQSVAKGVTRLALGDGLDLTTRRPWRRFEQGLAIGGERPESFDEAADGIAAHLGTVFGEIAAAFPGRTAAALSGGFDSRLILAGLLAHGERPKLFVYGDESSADVSIAREVAHAEGLSLRVVDKASDDRQRPTPDVESLVRSALFFDGLPNDGVHDAGSDRTTRLEQSADGLLPLNGGGGEIFRNFFHLRDARFRARDIVHAFYRGFDARVFRRAGEHSRYRDRLASSIERAVHLGGNSDARTGVLFSRAQIELAYPLFRCHHWMGVNNSVALRCGYFATPLLNLGSVRAAWALPLAWKNAGRLESRLITTMHPGIASHASSYGFRFSEGPGLHARWSERINGLRPVSARPLINAARRRLDNARADPGFIARARALFPGEWRVDTLLDLERLPDDAAFARALSIEVVSRELAP